MVASVFSFEILRSNIHFNDANDDHDHGDDDDHDVDGDGYDGRQPEPRQ